MNIETTTRVTLDNGDVWECRDGGWGCVSGQTYTRLYSVGSRTAMLITKLVKELGEYMHDASLQ